MTERIGYAEINPELQVFGVDGSVIGGPSQSCCATRPAVSHASRSDLAEALADKLVFLGLDWPAWWDPRLWCSPVALTQKEKRLLANFKCSEARCFMPADRGTLLARIREEWGSLDEFDDFVRNELPGVLLAGKRRYSTQLRRKFAETAQFLFG